MINLTDQQLLAIKNGYPRVFIVEYLLDTPIYLTDSMIDIEWNGKTYKSGLILSISNAELTSEAKISPMDIQLTAVDQLLVTEFKTGRWRNKRSNVYMCLLDNNYQLIGEPIAHHQGLIDKHNISDTEKTSTFTVTSGSVWRDFEKTSGRRTNNNSNHRHYPDDDGFWASSVDISDLPWGKKGDVFNPVYNKTTGAAE